MKKNSIYAFIVAIGLILSACGSNSKPDGTGSTATGTITTKLQKITVDKDSGNIAANVSVTSTYAKSIVATLSNMNLSLGGCSLVSGSVSANPDSVTLNSVTPSKNVVLTGTLADPSCVPTSYQITGTNTLAAEGKTVTRPFTTERVDINGTSIIDGTLKDTLTIVDPANRILDINTSNVEKSVTVRLTKGSTALANKHIKIMSNINTGSFFASTVGTDDQGKATFIYKSPAQINNENFDVKFCMEAEPTVCDTLKINLKVGQVTPPDNNTTPDTGNDFVNYGMSFKSEDGKNTLGLDERKLFTIALIDKDTMQPIPVSQVKKITVSSKKPDVITLIDPQDAVGNAVEKLVMENRNNINIYLKAAKKQSGLSDIVVKIEYTNQKGYSREMIKTYAITVFSGPPTAFSITDGGTSYDKESKRFEQKFVVSAADKYSNTINTSPTISVSVMAGYAKESNGELIVFGQKSAASASLVKGTPVTLDISGANPFVDFDNSTLYGVDPDRDFVALFGNVRTYEANGKWEIDSIAAANKLLLSDSYEGENYPKLGFAIGHNYRHDMCSDEFREYEVKVQSQDGKYRLDEEGKAYVTIRYPAEFMPGKRVGLLVNLISENPETGKQLRGGEVRFETLNRTSPFGLSGGTTTVTKGTTKEYILYGTVETGTGDKFALHNSTFSCFDGESKNISLISIEKNDPKSCVRPYVKYKVTTANSTEDGTLTLSDCRVDQEPIFRP